ncbi:MAG: DEAD/DEAH box helicase [Alphaproteobacteria bacterium]|nr:DEAD/DEAH box helicase [Alphaproteobacteria bacterium]
MKPDELRLTLGDRGKIQQDPFSVARMIADVCNVDPDAPLAREMVIRALDHADLFARLDGLLDALARHVGLFPYAAPEKLGLRDRLAWEAHRPLDLQLDGKDIVFHREQADVYRGLMDGQSFVLSAPTSFGKSLVIDALIASGRYRNIVIIVPTIALIDETRRRLGRFRDKYKLITHPGQAPAESNILIVTQERAIDRDDIKEIDLLVIDEFYKLDPASDEERDRASALNHALYKLSRIAKQIYLLGPNINDIPKGFGARFKCQFKRTDFNTVVSEVRRLMPKPNREEAFVKLCRSLDEPTLVYCKSPKQANDIMRLLVRQNVTAEVPELARAADWVAATYHPQWSLGAALRRGIGIHHGRLPRSLAQLMVSLFNDRHLRFLICTSSLIEGVNTSAKNVVIYESKIGVPRLDYFTFKNILGRAGRMRRHFIGKVYTFDEPPAEELDFVDIPVFTQGDDTSLGLLVQIDEEDLRPDAGERLTAIRQQDVLSMATIKVNAHVDPEDQIALARELTQRWRTHFPLLSWYGPYPTWENLKAVCVLIYKFFVKRPRQGIFTGPQLAFRLMKLRACGSTAAFVREIMENDKYITTADEAVESGMEFIRNWAGFTFPRYLNALDRIQAEVFGRSGLRPGNYAAYAAEVESLFMPGEIPALEEYGLPTEVGRKIQGRLIVGQGLDAALMSLQRADLGGLPLSLFELEVIERCRVDL